MLFMLGKIYKKNNQFFLFPIIIYYIVMKGRLNEKCEIYSFGVVLVELLTGKRIFDENLPSDSAQRVAEILKPILINKEMIIHVMDPSIHGQYSVAATRAALLANKCVMTYARHRPNANDLVNELEQIQHL
ncbi:putative transferase [Helianthus annuus]|uniref:Transferase n=2 Tax=Helianthus annuus TaxID=4232 RepID=A0A251VGI6_HELAN|nr:putative transferase [Helianthus annuus]KAJ0475193.1 putative transferase [Helianthus annuus]KAJ0650744.1 putative transferase [Helianthus annuus]KAJ0654501.1 putative transferase [Helianthus annuus]KAJ0833564.1 putative transferase [Helianthus annuus]